MPHPRSSRRNGTSRKPGPLVAFGLAILAGSAPAQEPSNETLTATLWVQHSPEYRATCQQAYALAELRLREALADPGWTAVLEQSAAEARRLDALGLRGVILDLDETVLDNSAYAARILQDGREFDPSTWSAWVREEKAGAIPGARAFVQAARKHRVHIYYLSNRLEANLEPTRRNLLALGFPVGKKEASFLLKTKSSDKGARRTRAAQGHRILLSLGDAQGDFSSAFRGRTPFEQKALYTSYADYWGKRWIAFPNPNYGNWLSGWGVEGSRAERLAALRGVLETKRAARQMLLPSGPLHERLAAGPMNAWTGMRESAVWVQTNGATRVQLRYWETGRIGSAKLSPELHTSKEGDHIALFELEGLQSGQRYSYELYLEGQKVPVPWQLMFRTKPQWRYRGPAPDITFTFGSCLYVNDGVTDRPGRPYGGDYETLLAAAQEKPDFMLWLGDNWYLRAPDWQSPEGMRRRARYVRAFGPLQPLLGVTQHYAIWDDHDYGPNNSDRGWMFKDASLDIFADYFPQPAYGTRKAPGFYYTFEWSDAQFFMLDNRSHRAPNEHPDSPDKRMFGREQMQWLEDNLRASSARFKFIAAGNQMLNPMTFFEAFGNYPHEQQELFDFLVKEKIGGVIFLSGDRHAGELIRYRHEGSKSYWYDFTSSPLGSGSGRYMPEAENPARVPGTWVTRTRNYGRVRLLGKGDERRVVMSAHDKAGRQLWEHSVRAAELWH